MTAKTQGIVIDCSFIMAVLLPDESSERTESILSSDRYSPVAPVLWTIEVSTVLQTAVRRNRITAEPRDLLVKNLLSLPIQIDRRDVSMSAIISLASTYSLTAYDAVYLDLALRTAFPLATYDHELRNAALKADIAVL